MRVWVFAGPAQRGAAASLLGTGMEKKKRSAAAPREDCGGRGGETYRVEHVGAARGGRHEEILVVARDEISSRLWRSEVGEVL